MIYLDHSATTPVSKEVLKAMLPYFSNKYGNASSLYNLGQESSNAIENSRKIIANFLKCSPDEIVFTSSGTESDNLAIKGVALSTNKKHIITSVIEHPAVYATCKFLESRGYKVTYLNVNKEGIISVEELKNAITDDTFLVSIMHANNEIGTIQPIEEIGKICKEKGILFHTDAVQSFGKIPIDLTNIDLLSVSAHKIYGPKGVGFLYIKKGTRITPILNGGGQESGLRSSTENVPYIVGLGKAVSQINLKKEKSLEKLRDYLTKELLKIPESRLNGSRTKRLPNNVNISFKHIEGEALLLHLNSKGIAASTGSACSTKSLKPSRILTSIGLCPKDAHGSLRLTLGHSTTKQQLNTAIKYIKHYVQELRAISPLNKKTEGEYKQNFCKT